MDALCIVAAAMAKSGYCAEATRLGTTYKALLEYPPLWGIIKDLCSPTGAAKYISAGMVGFPLLRRIHPRRTRLMYAARTGNTERFNWLLARGANPHLVDEKGFSALHHAVFYGRTLHRVNFHGHTEIVRRLIELRVDVNAYTVSHDRVLNFAAKNRYKEIVQMLCAAGAKSNELSSAIYDAIDEQYPFYMNRMEPWTQQDAAEADSLSAEIVDILYKAGGTLDSNETAAAFIKVISRGQLKTLKMLIAHGCNPMAYYYALQGEPFLHLAIANRRVEVLQELCRIGMWINGVDSEGRSPLDMIDLWKRSFGSRLYRIIEAKLDAMEKILLEHGAKKMMYR